MNERGMKISQRIYNLHELVKKAGRDLPRHMKERLGAIYQLAKIDGMTHSGMNYSEDFISSCEDKLKKEMT